MEPDINSGILDSKPMLLISKLYSETLHYTDNRQEKQSRKCGGKKSSFNKKVTKGSKEISRNTTKKQLDI